MYFHHTKLVGHKTISPSEKKQKFAEETQHFAVANPVKIRPALKGKFTYEYFIENQNSGLIPDFIEFRGESI